jgi:RNA polymerase-binding transcription factor DksA
MTESERKYLERRLLEERGRATRVLAAYAESARNTSQDQAGDLSKMPLHLADEGTDTAQSEFDAANAVRETAILAQIDEALRRLYNEPERFGRADDTGQEIPFARLDIIPWARTTARPDNARGVRTSAP